MVKGLAQGIQSQGKDTAKADCRSVLCSGTLVYMQLELHDDSVLLVGARSFEVESQCLARWHADLLDAQARRDRRRRRRLVVFGQARGPGRCGAKVVQNAAGELCIIVSYRDRQK